jgi:YgiT-type zinc finger domain-containing protein
MNGERAMRVPARCAACGEPCEDRAITLSLPRSATGIAVVRNVPAEVCLGCGETQFSLQTTGLLMAVVRSDRPPDEVATVPIYDFYAIL